MATKSKPSRKSAARKTGKNRKKPGILLIMIILALAAILFSYFYAIRTTENDLSGIFSSAENIFTLKSDSINKTDETKVKPQNTQEPAKNVAAAITEKTILEGTWVSTFNGALLSFEANRFKLEFPSVEKRPTLEGHFKIIERNIHLVNTLSDDLCGMENGIYSYTFNGENLVLEAESDPCQMRKENLSTDWFNL